MMATARVQRGRQTEELVAQYLREHGWPFASRIAASLPGADIENTPGLSIEVKARRDLNIPAWLKQAMSRPGVPLLIHRPDGFGPERIDLWPMTIPLKNGVELLGQAGYGNPY